ncbi:AAA family ATPase [Enterobacter mori]|uniref:AAA family ATPase n=1 Tax=Enterobacter mori TaxID=539813 RepID=UPI003B840A16
MTLKENLTRLMADKKYSQKRVSAQIGISSAALSLYMRDEYAGNVDNIEAAISNFLTREDDKSKSRTVNVSFVKTRLAGKCLSLVRNTHLDGDIGVLYGSAGLGKTQILKHYASTYKDVILIEADPGYTAKVLLQELCERLGVGKRGNIHELTENCISALQGTGWLIAIDEAELLPYRALEVLRRIHDRSGVGVVLAGMPRLLLNLKGRMGEYAQLYSRVGMAIDLDTEKVKTDREDFCSVLASLLPEDVKRDEKLDDCFWQSSRGNYRRLFKLARGVVRASELNDGISVALVEEYASMLIH